MSDRVSKANYYLDIAQTVAERATCMRRHFGAIIVKDDVIVSTGYHFKAMDGLITNFHLPESTLVMLVSAFYNREKILEAYKNAVDEKYRFFSFGDCMFIY